MHHSWFSACRLTAPLLWAGALVAATPVHDAVVQGAIQGAINEDVVQAGLEAVRAKAGLPALGGAIVTSEKLEGVWVTGLRRAADPAHDKEDFKVESDDRWHLGSCTKSMTATLIALLVERGDLDWETTPADVFPELGKKMDDAYKTVSLAELLTHRAGVPSDLSRDGLWTRCWKREGTPTEQRRMLTRTLLEWGPIHPPGGKYLYANAGFAIAGHMAETVAKKPWEELMQELLFQPLGMKSAGFGAPGTPDQVDEPRGHDPAGKPVEPGPAADNPPAIGPGGTVHASLADWAKYIQLHLRGARDAVKVGEITLSKETFARLHEPAKGEGSPYAMGWGVAKRPWAGGDGTVWTHNGSNTMWFCVTWLAPHADFAVLVTTNMVGTTGQQAVDEAAGLLIQARSARKRDAP